jgi:recombination associated protein RdgC
MFKNAKVYRLQVPFELDQNGLHERLLARRFRQCGPVETASLGWTPPLGPKAELLVHAIGEVYLVAMRRQERLLPGSVVTEAVADRIAELEQAEMREVGRRERSRLREELLTEMLPKAFTRSRLVRAFIDADAGWVVVDAASDKAAEEVITLLRESLGSFPVKPLASELAPAERFSTWILAGQAADSIELEDSCVLQDPEDTRSTVRCRGQDLSSAEVRNHIESGKRAVSVGILWQDRLSLLLNEDLTLKRLRFADTVIEALDTGDADDEGAVLDAELALLSLELRVLLQRLCQEFEIAGPAEMDADGRVASAERKPESTADAEPTSQGSAASGSTESPPWA